MAKKTNQDESADATKADIKRLETSLVRHAKTTKENFEWLARIMKEGFEDMETKMDKKIEASEGRLRTEIRTSEENLQYRISNVATDVFRHLDTKIEPKIRDHEMRIKKLEHRDPAHI